MSVRLKDYGIGLNIFYKFVFMFISRCIGIFCVVFKILYGFNNIKYFIIVFLMKYMGVVDFF